MGIYVDKPKVGSSAKPTLTKKPSVTIDPGADARRVMAMGADNEFNEKVNRPITDPSARSYAARVQERMTVRKAASALKGKSPPLGHVESPPSDKMAAIAQSQGHMSTPRFDELPPDMQHPPDIPRGPAQPQGVGAAYPVNQAMAHGRIKDPVSLREANKMAGSSNFSPETIEALKMAHQNIEAQQSGPQESPQEPEPEPEVKKSMAEETRDELDEIEKEFEPDSPLTDMDMASLSNIRTGLMSKERKEAIEARLEALDLADMIVKREIQQTVPIIPGKFEVTLRTFSQRENLWILKYLYDFPGSALYTNELLNTCRLVCGLVAVNGQYLPDHREDPGGPREAVTKEAFEKKMFHVVSFPVQMVADMSVQSIWFQDRVDKLFTVDSLKNG